MKLQEIWQGSAGLWCTELKKSWKERWKWKYRKIVIQDQIVGVRNVIIRVKGWL